MIPIVAAAIVGGLACGLTAASQGIIAGLLAAPLGGSASALLVAVALAYRRGPGWQRQDDLDEQTDAMVAALRDVAEQGRTQAEDAPADERSRRSA